MVYNEEIYKTLLIPWVWLTWYCDTYWNVPIGGSIIVHYQTPPPSFGPGMDTCGDSDRRVPIPHLVSQTGGPDVLPQYVKLSFANTVRDT